MEEPIYKIAEEIGIEVIPFRIARETANEEIKAYVSQWEDMEVDIILCRGSSVSYTHLMGQDSEYYKRTANQVAAFIPDDSIYLGSFLCPGKMPPQVLEKYRRMQRISDTPQMRTMIKNYEEAMLHPDHEDLMNAKKFANEILQKKGSYEYGNTRG